MQKDKAIPGGGVRAWLARLAVPERSPQPYSVPRLDRRLAMGLWILLVFFSFHGVFGHSLWGGNDTREGGMIWDMFRNGTYVTRPSTVLRSSRSHRCCTGPASLSAGPPAR